MDIETSKNDNNLEEESYENSIEAEDDDNLIEEVETIQEDYITDEYDNVIIHDSDIKNGEENYNDVDEFKAESEDSFSEKVDSENYYEDKNYSSEQDNSRVIKERKEAYDEGYKDGYEKGAKDAIKAAFRAGFRYGIRRSRYSK